MACQSDRTSCDVYVKMRASVSRKPLMTAFKGGSRGGQFGFK